MGNLPDGPVSLVLSIVQECGGALMRWRCVSCGAFFGQNLSVCTHPGVWVRSPRGLTPSRKFRPRDARRTCAGDDNGSLVAPVCAYETLLLGPRVLSLVNGRPGAGKSIWVACRLKMVKAANSAV